MKTRTLKTIKTTAVSQQVSAVGFLSTILMSLSSVSVSGRSKIFLMELKRKCPPAINRLSHLMIHIYSHLVAVFVVIAVVVVLNGKEKHDTISLNSPYHFLVSAIGDPEKDCLNK